MRNACIPRVARKASNRIEHRVIKPAKCNDIVSPSYDALREMTMFRENPNVQPEKSVVPCVPLPIPLVVADAPPDAVARTKMGKRLHVVSPLAYKSIDEVACNRDQVGVESVDALYDALEARTTRRCRAMKIAKVDDAVAVERLRKVVVLYFDAIHVGSPHALVDSPRGKSSGENRERGKYAASDPHGNAYLRKPKQIAHHVKRKRRGDEQNGRGVYPAVAPDDDGRKIRRKRIASDRRKEGELAESDCEQRGRGECAAP